MPKIDNNLILVKGQDKTEAISHWEFDRYKPTIYITYRNGKSYPYNKANVQFFRDPKVEVLKDRIALKNGSPLSGATTLQFFEDHCRVIFKTGFHRLENASDICIIESAFLHPIAKKRFEYFKQLSLRTGLCVDGKNILAEHYKKITFVREDSILSDFLKGEYSFTVAQNKVPLIYPFGFNLSQKQAVDNAMQNRISIIEGPPGTGKTQTILNIIANAVMRGESVAVVSSNNSATRNVLEKLEKHQVAFIAAFLGNTKNKEEFIENQSCTIPDLTRWLTCTTEKTELQEQELQLNRKLEINNLLSKYETEKNSLEKELLHFDDYYRAFAFNTILPEFSDKVCSEKILQFSAEYEYILNSKVPLGFFKKLFLKFSYRLKNLKFWGIAPEKLKAYCQKLYYNRRLIEIEKEILKLKNNLESYNFDYRMKSYSNLSMDVFKLSLANKYYGISERRKYTMDDLWKHSEEFIRDYPVILSTTYSLRSSLSKDYVYDYLIIDEASQVDLATGVLALSCAKKVVVVGDTKQLPNVVDKKQQQLTDEVFTSYGLPSAYQYSNHSLLTSLIQLFPNVPRVLLREHYRCHPDIIGFCNQRFYDNQLIIMSKVKGQKEPLLVYRTVPGNHARDHVNYRQIEVITNEVFPQQKLNRDDGSVGIVTPFRNQANVLQQVFSDTKVKADTADKFQGQERNVMIFSTVDNEIGDFASNPNRLNVAVSRAIEQFIVVTDGNNNDKTSPIHDLIDYIQYQNHEIVNSEIHSVFDYLYKGQQEARERILRKYGRVSEVDSENLLYAEIKGVISEEEFSQYDVVLHVPLTMILNRYEKLNEREWSFATDKFSHVDFLIFSKVTRQPILVIEVDGYKYHTDEIQRERDRVKDSIFKKYNIPMLRFSTVGSGEKERLKDTLTMLSR